MNAFASDNCWQAPKNCKLALAKELLQAGNELAAKHAAENSHGQEEVLLRMNPALVVWRKSSARHHTMDMWMRLQGLSPRMQNTQEANESSEALGVGGYFE